MARPAGTFVSTLRKILLLALAVILLALGGLLLFGRAGLDRDRPRDQAAETPAGPGMTLVGEDFDYTFTEREKPIFRIRGDSVRADENDKVYLDGVRLTVYDEQGRPFHVESKRATFSRETNEGELAGSVLLKGPGNLELRTEKLDLKDRGQVIVTQGGVEIRYGGLYLARAERMRVDLPEDLYVLAGQVRVETLPGAVPPASLACERLAYDRSVRSLHVEGNAVLTRGPDQLKARRMTADLTADETGLTFVRAFWGFSGRARANLASLGTQAGRTLVQFEGKHLAVLLLPESGQARKVEMEAQRKSKAVISSSEPGLTRTLRAFRFEGFLENGVLAYVEAFGGVTVDEEARRGKAPPKLRHAEGDRAEARFTPAGRVATVTLNGGVRFDDGQVEATGTRATIDLEANRGEFLGVPVEIVSPRGTVRAPRVVYNTENEVVTARGGVRAVLVADDDALAGSALAGGGEEPVKVESQEAFWRQKPSSFVFRGDVRAWRGDNLLLAPELRGDQEKDWLTASGGVKSLFVPEPEKAEPESKPAPRAPIEVTAAEMVYQQGSGVLTYSGDVRVEQEGRILVCQRLDVELEKRAAVADGADGGRREVETMTCSGQTKLNDPQTGRKIEGDKAIYQTVLRKIEVIGNPVILRDRDGNKVQGRRLLYDLADGKVEVKGGGGS